MGIGIDKKDVSQGLTCLSPWGMDGMKKQRESPGMSPSSPLFSPFPRHPIEPFLFDVDIPDSSRRATGDRVGEGTRVPQWSRQSPSKIRRSWTAAPRDSILKMTGIPLGPMNSRIAHWFLLATAETLFPQLTEACVRSSGSSSRGSSHTPIAGVTHSPARSPHNVVLLRRALIEPGAGELVRSIALLRG